MLPYSENSRYTRCSTTNNIVVVGRSSPQKILGPRQDLPFPPSANIPVLPCQANPTVPYQDYNSGLQTTTFMQTAMPQYWTPNYAAPTDVGSFQWEPPYQGTLEPQNNHQFVNGPGQMLHNNQLATGIGHTVHGMAYDSQPFGFESTEIIRNVQPFAFGNSGRVHHSQPSAIGTGHMLHDGQPFAIAFGAGEIANNNNQTYPFAIGQLENLSQCYCERLSGKVPVPHTYNYAKLENEQNFIKSYSAVQPAYYIEATNSTSSKAAPNKVKYNEMSLEPAKPYKENKDVSLTAQVSPLRPDTPVRDENKSPVECARSFPRINKKEKSHISPLQKIKIANSNITQSKLLTSDFHKNYQVTKRPSTSYNEEKTQAIDTERPPGHSGKRLNTSTCTSIKSEFEYSKREVEKSSFRNKSETKPQEPKSGQKKTKKTKSTLIEKLKLKLQKVDEEIRKRRIDLTIKNKLIKKELSSGKFKALASNDQFSKCHSIKNTEVLKSSECIKTELDLHAKSPRSPKNEVINAETRSEKTGKNISRVKSVVKVVKRQKKTEVNKSQNNKESYRSHREKYYIIQKSDSIHKTAQSDHIFKGSTLHKSKVKCRNTTFNTKRDDLLIMFNNRDTEEEQPQERKVKVQKRKEIDESNCKENLRNPTKIRKIDLIINVVTKKSEPDVNTSSESELLTDLSFLDDINADEIVEYLRSSENQANCESDIAHDTLGASETPIPRTVDEIKDGQCCILNSNFNDSTIIDTEEVKLEPSTNGNKTETGTNSLLTGDNESHACVSPIICSPELNPADAVTLLKPDLNGSSVGSRLKPFTESDKYLTACNEINNNGVSRETQLHNLQKSTMIVEDKPPNFNMTESESHEVLTITEATTDEGIARCNANNDDLEKSAVVVEDSHPDVITIVDDTEVITIIDDVEDVITIADDDVINVANEAQERTMIKDEVNNITRELLRNAEITKAPKHLINPTNKILKDVSESSTMNTVLSSNTINKSQNDSCRSEDGLIKIGDRATPIKDIMPEIKTSSTSFEAKESRKKSATSEASNCNVKNKPLGQCDKYPCKELHEVIEQQEASKRAKKYDVTKVKAIYDSIYSAKQLKKLANKLAAKELEAKLREEALAQTLEKRVSDYMNLDLRVSSVLHRGTFSILFNCIDREGLHVAAKIINRDCEDCSTKVKQKGYKKETMLMKLQNTIPREKLDFVYMINGLAIEENWCLLMDYYPKNLEQALRESGRGFHVIMIQKFAEQLISAVTMLTRNGVVHSDIKPRHILMDANNTTIKLCGFDESYYVEEAQKVSNVGTVHYRAPEVILGHSAGHGIDVWATAVVLYEMATGDKLFPGTSNNEVLYQHLSTLGAAPWPMVLNSAFRNAHYVGQKFRRRSFCTVNNVTTMLCDEISTFPKTGFARNLLQTYTRNWCKTKKDEELTKLTRLYSILCQMLIMDPTKRISVFALKAVK